MTALSSPFPIQPLARGIDAAVRLPGSKSITNRALVLAALADGETTLTGALFSRDTRIMVAALQQLGFEVDADEGRSAIRIVGLGGKIPVARATLQLGNAGTVARFLPALLALHPEGHFAFECDLAMSGRPMSGLFEALRSQGSRFTTANGSQADGFPCVQQTSGLRGGEIRVNARASSQILSALLMAAPLAASPANVILDGATVSKPFVAMTLRMMAQFGCAPENISQDALASGEFGNFKFNARNLRETYCSPKSYEIEPDATAASYFLALPIATSAKIRVHGFSANPLQGDIAFCDVLRQLGLPLQNDVRANALCAASPAAPLRGGDFNFNAISDTFLTLAALAPLLTTPTTIRGIAHARRQETDRVLAVATELERLNQRTSPSVAELRANPALGDLTIFPDLAAMRHATARTPVSIQTYDDHRIAMSFAILGLHNLHGDARPWLHIENPSCTSKTFPNFFPTLSTL